ncbi:hypothetical protein MSAN_01634400 [Mycena sanguinolenta]|uniref:Uncharacterized protein n=1 Tax=Mycena sanguinolenta TaxID=230812 RepID=A0A8H6XYM5_9AGAR|nr:hypothetical protein MSAN_01634400 [Mycena sanguinolenta]
MFSKVLAFGLGALAIVRAAPAFSFQMPMLSCSPNFDTSVAAVKANAIEPGRYLLYNEAWGDKQPSQLRGYAVGEPVFVAYSDLEPGVFGVWDVIHSESEGSDEYRLVNLGLRAAASVFKDQVVTSQSGENFEIEPAGNGLFTIKVPNENLVWTVDTPNINRLKSNVYLRQQVGALAAKWKLVRV